jgi:DNA-binding PadR family transcriptional regulator
MGWKHDMWAWTANVDTPAECLTLLWLNQRADDDSGECFPSAEDIAAHTRLNRKTVFAALKSLTEKGLIETKKRPGPGRRNLYRLCYERTENGTSQKWNVPETVLSTSQKRDFQSTKNGTSNVPETVRETTIETTTESIRNQQEVMCAPAGAPYPEDFDQSLFNEARSMGSEPNVEITIEAPAPAPQKRKAAPRRKPATPCPFDADASIPDEYKAIAEKVGIGNPQQVFSAFVNHALATDRRLTVWPAGFRTWCLNELRYHPLQTAKPKPLHQRTADDYNW